MSYKTVPLTPDLLPAFEELFGEHGACNGCWCMYWRIGAEYHKRDRALNKKDFRRVVKDGPPPGLLAFKDDMPVGWCQLTPKTSLSWLSQDRRFQAVDDIPVWCISCFYIKRGFRKQGVTSALIKAAIQYAKQLKIPAIEAYPSNGASSFTGYSSTFQKAGFKTISRRNPNRPVMRLVLSTLV